MFGSKLRAWMEAVRPKKKQHRKEKQGKNRTLLNNRPSTNDHNITWKTTCLLEGERKDIKQDPSVNYLKSHNDTINEKPSRYSAINLSSPESAYSTGYSTDGTSPGAVAPPEYLIKSSNQKCTEERLKNRLNPDQVLPAGSSKTYFFKSQPSDSSTLIPDNLKIKESVEEEVATIISSTKILGNISDNVLISPRQRNRIRTNPWVPGGSAVPSPLPVRQEVTMTPTTVLNIFRNSPIHHRYLSPVSHRRSISSSSCSSLSAGPNQHFPRSFSDAEDDCTLNEMMGKYDESYVYEKETDILSDSDPTDCESDLDTGQDGGDEDDNADIELDFIDNGSYVEIDRKTGNTGHCLYFIPSSSSDTTHRKRSARRRTTRKVKEAIGDSRRKSSASKKICRHADRTRHWSVHQDGSKSAGATPLSVRKSSITPPRHKKEEFFKKRSNSVCLQRDTTVLIHKRDREADLKYKELIGQAEQIIRTMNINGLSPRRLPGPTNKRVELLRSTEFAKPDVLFKSKPTDEPLIPQSIIPPSTAIFKNNRFSPKKNHITNFIINNSPVLVRKELHQLQSPIAIKKNLMADVQKSPLVMDSPLMHQKKHIDLVVHPGQHQHMLKERVDEYCGSATSFTKNHHPKRILRQSEHISPSSILSPRHRRAAEIPFGSSSSSEEEICQRSKNKLFKSCPQSEPMRRKSYLERNAINTGRGHGKTVAFNLNSEIPNVSFRNEAGSSENLRHQVLLNTIQSLKQNLEDQSASLQQTYKGGTERTYNKY